MVFASTEFADITCLSKIIYFLNLLNYCFDTLFDSLISDASEVSLKAVSEFNFQNSRCTF